MQEEVENRTVNLAISTTKLTFRTLLNGYRAWNNHRQKVKAKKSAQKMVKPVGKQTIKQLLGQNQGVSSIPIENTGIHDFARIAGKYGIDYAITKDKSELPPKFTIFFKARDADAMTAAFTEYSNQKLNTRQKPSVLGQLKKLAQLVAAAPDKVRHKNKERDER